MLAASNIMGLARSSGVLSHCSLALLARNAVTSLRESNARAGGCMGVPMCMATSAGNGVGWPTEQVNVELWYEGLPHER